MLKMTNKKQNPSQSPQTFEVFAHQAKNQNATPQITHEFQIYREGAEDLSDVDDIFSQAPVDPDILLKMHKDQPSLPKQVPQKLERIDPNQVHPKSFDLQKKINTNTNDAHSIENEFGQKLINIDENERVDEVEDEDDDESEDEEILFENTEEIAPSKFLSLSLFWLTFGLTLYIAYQTAIAYVGFKIEHFQVVGQEKIDEQELLTFLKLKANTENFFKFDLEKVEDELKKHPWIGEYQVSKHFPNTVKIEIKEKKTKGVALLDSLMAIDENGMPFVAITPKERKELPIISGLPKSLFDHPDTKMIGQLLMKKAIYVHSLYEKSNLKKYKKLSDIYISQTGRIELMLDHTRVSLGNDHFKQRIQYLEKILSYLAHQDSDVSYILLSEDLNRAIIQESAFDVKSEINQNQSTDAPKN
jgi:cell division septal protein FtsQ